MSTQKQREIYNYYKVYRKLTFEDVAEHFKVSVEEVAEAYRIVKSEEICSHLNAWCCKHENYIKAFYNQKNRW